MFDQEDDGLMDFCLGDEVIIVENQDKWGGGSGKGVDQVDDKGLQVACVAG